MKSSLRKEVLRKRDELAPDARMIKDGLIKERLLALPEFCDSGTVLLYASFRSEVSTRALIEESMKAGKRVILPRVGKDKHMLDLYEIKNVEELVGGFMGIPEPPPDDERVTRIDDIDIVVAPGAAFDMRGNRLGYGGGYYDRLLSRRGKKMPVVALGYEEQMVELIPAEAHDVRVDVIVTDKRVIRIR